MQPHVREGQFFLLPLGKGTGQYAVGIVARVPRRGGVLLGYFFGPRRREPPGLEWLNSLRADQAAFVCRFKDTQIYRGEWRLLCVREPFDRAKWPVPAFHRFDGSATQVPGVAAVQDWRVEYADDNLIMPVAERPAAAADLKLGEDAVLDWTLLADEVGKRIGEMIPTADDSTWR
jgi:hypothetical protein